MSARHRNTPDDTPTDSVASRSAFVLGKLLHLTSPSFQLPSTRNSGMSRAGSPAGPPPTCSRTNSTAVTARALSRSPIRKPTRERVAP
ncbi:MAG: hypothetical protein U0470_12855 [Anaerolineae bacterium]